MKKWFLLILFVFVLKLFAFEIIVIGIRDTDTMSITSQELYSSIGNIHGLSMRNYSLGSGVFLSYPGLSSVNTSIIFSGITLNSLKLGTFDLANFPQFLLNNTTYFNEDISFINGINGIGGGININYFLRNKIKSSLFIDSYYSDFNLVIPIKFNGGLFNLMYENRNGDSGRTNSQFKRNYYGFSFKPINKLRIIYTYSNENLGVPGPIPPDDENSFLYNGTDATYTKNKQIAKYENLFLTYTAKNILLSFNYKKDIIDYYYYTMWGNGISNNTDKSMKSFAKINIYDNKNYRVNGAISLMKQFNDENIDFSRENLLLQFYLKRVGIGSNIQIYGSNLNKFNFGGNLYFENYIFGLKILAIISKGVRFPTYNEMYYPFGGNRDLQDEHSYNFSLKLSTKNLSLTYDHKYIHNMILWVPYDYFYYKTENIGKKQIDTIGFNINYKFYFISVKNNFNIYFGKEENAFMDINGNSFTKIQDASYLPNISETLLINFNINNAQLIFGLNYRGEMINNYIDKKLSPLLTMDIILKGKLFSIGVKNILNNKGAVNFGYDKDDLDYPNMGRDLFMEMRF